MVQNDVYSSISNYFIESCATAYYCNLAKGTIRILQKKGLKEEELAKESMPYENGIIYFVNEYVHPDDRSDVLEKLSSENVKRTLQSVESYTFSYRDTAPGSAGIYRCVVIRGEDTDHAAFLFWNVSEDPKEEKKISRKGEDSIISQELLNQMLGDEGLFLIDLSTDTRRVIHDHTRWNGTFDDKEKYSDSILKYINTDVAEADRRMMREVTSADYILSRIEKEREFRVEYRDISEGIQRFYEMKIAKFSDHEVLQSFSERDKEIVGRLVFNKLKEEYFALYGVDLDSGLIQVLKDSPWYPMGEVGMVREYGPIIKTFASSFKGEAREFFENMSDIDYLKRRFATEDKSTFSYYSHIANHSAWVLVTELVIARHDDGSPSLLVLGFSLLDADAIEKEKLQRKLKEAYEAAEMANSSKTRFLFNMSHDIRTPMNAIVGFTTMAKRFVGDTDKVLDYLNKIDISGQQLLMLINQVLEMSRIESGKVEFNETHANVKDNYDSLVTVLAEQAKANGLEFYHEMGEITHTKVLADEAKMSQITLNIAGNAIKYTPKGGRIYFKLRENPCEREGYASFTFTVADTGIGMSKEYQKVLFEPFTREKTSTVSKIQGTGLGMSIVKSLVDFMGGTIDVQSEPGKGSKFDITIEFRIAEDKPAPVARRQMRNNGMHLKGRRCLLVEDNELNREIARFLLEEQGIIVEEAEDGDIALEKIQTMTRFGEYYYYDFILMDIQMPRMNGYETAAHIRAIPGPEGCHIPIIALTANAFEEDRKNALAAGMDDHLAKPINVDKLKETLAKFL